MNIKNVSVKWPMQLLFNCVLTYIKDVVYLLELRTYVSIQKRLCTLDTVNNCKFLKEVYLKADPGK